MNDTEKKSLTKRVDDLEAVDQLGKSFKSSDLTNEEMLRIGYSIFGPTKNFGFTSITFDSLNRTYIKGFLGREDVVAKDITCSCALTAMGELGFTDAKQLQLLILVCLIRIIITSLNILTRQKEQAPNQLHSSETILPEAIDN